MKMIQIEQRHFNGLARRLSWFVLLWMGGVAVVAVTGLLIKLALS